MTPKEKRKLLVQLIELLVFGGYDITPYVGFELKKFDFEGGVQKVIDDLKKEQKLEEYSEK